jgi:hypothetical protein
MGVDYHAAEHIAEMAKAGGGVNKYGQLNVVKLSDRQLSRRST